MMFSFSCKAVTWGPFRVLECLVKQLLFNLALNESILVTSSFLFYLALFIHHLDAIYCFVASVLSFKY